MAGSILTNTGLAKLAAATAEQPLNITNIAVGDGNGGFPTLSPTMTALTNEVWRGAASNPIRDSANSNYVYFETNIPPEVGPFDVREIACFDFDGDMIAIGHTSLIQKPDPNDDASFTVAVRIFIALENASDFDLIYQNVEVTSHNSLTNRDSIGAHDSIYNRKIKNIQELKLLPVNENSDGNEFLLSEYHQGTGYGGGKWLCKLKTAETPNNIDIVESEYDNRFIFIINEKSFSLLMIGGKPDYNTSKTDNSLIIERYLQIRTVIDLSDGFFASSSGEHEFLNKLIVGSGYEKCGIICTSTDPTKKCAYLSGRTSIDGGVQFGFDEAVLSGTEFKGQRVGVVTGKTFALQRTRLGPLKIKNTGTAIASLDSLEESINNVVFSVTFDNLVVENYTHKGVDFDTKTRTGNAYLNVFIDTEDSKKHAAPFNNQHTGFSLSGQENECFLGQVNVERSKLKENAFLLDGVSGIAGGSFHYEDTILTSNYRGVIKLNSTAGNLSSLSVINCDITTEGFSIIELGDAKYSEAEVNDIDNNTMIFELSSLNLKRLNRENGLTTLTNQRLVYRPNGKSGLYKVSINSLKHLTNASVNDTDLYINMESGLNSPTILNVKWQDGVSRIIRGSINFSSESTKTISFNTSMPDSNYEVFLSKNVGAKNLSWINKTQNGFDIKVTDHLGSEQNLTGPVNYLIVR